VGLDQLELTFAQGREVVKRRAVTTALALTRRALLDWKGRSAGS